MQSRCTVSPNPECLLPRNSQITYKHKQMQWRWQVAASGRSPEPAAPLAGFQQTLECRPHQAAGSGWNGPCSLTAEKIIQKAREKQCMTQQATRLQCSLTGAMNHHLLVLEYLFLHDLVSDHTLRVRTNLVRMMANFSSLQFSGNKC